MRRRLRLLCGLLAALCLSLLVNVGLAENGAQVESWCVAVWHPSSEHPDGAKSILANADVIDMVFPFWYTPDAGGRILTRAPSDWRGQVSAWRAAGLLVLPSVFSTHSGFLKEPDLTRHIDELVELTLSSDFDGLDLDYEEFPLATKDAYSEFVERLRAALAERGKLLSVTVHAKREESPEGAPSAAAQDWPRLAAAADIFNVMTYDYTSRNRPPGPISPRSWVADVMRYGVTATGGANLQVGVPLYGYVWKRGRPPAVATTWEATSLQVKQFSLEPERERDSGELIVELDVPGLPKQVTYVSDATTTQGRLERLADDGLLGAGVAIWGVGGEDPGAWEALRRARPADCRFRSPQQGAR